MFDIKKYSAQDKTIWDKFVQDSKIDTFLFQRDFMEYHSDKFADHSLMVYRKNKLAALLPGNIDATSLFSHQGLTYGGLITARSLGIIDILESFQLIQSYLKSIGVEKLIYKPVPYIYHLIPNQDDLYAIYRSNAKRIQCHLSSTIYLQNKIPFIESRKSGIRKAVKENIIISKSENFNYFWQILENNLLKIYEKRPTHSLQEILDLKLKFPDNIELFIAQKHTGEILGGCVCFVMRRVVHVQYIAADETGKQFGALDLLFDTLINNHYKNYLVFDFGHSTEQSGNYLNENLVFQKEGFGGRSTIYETYEIPIL